MRRGILTGKACSGCRKKKRKCDGLTPCSNCRARQDQCIYNQTQWTSKDGLRSEILEFKKREAITETVIDALRSPTRGAPVLEQLQRGESLVEIENKLVGGGPARASSSASTGRRAYSDDVGADFDPDAEGEYEDGGDGAAGPDDSEMRSPSPISRAGSASAALPHPPPHAGTRSSSSNITTAGGGAHFFPRHWGEIYLSSGSASPSVPSPPQLQPPQHSQHHHHRVGGGLDSSKKQPTTFSLAMMERMMMLLFAWECPPLTMITREAFTADFVVGRQNRYCSWPLICAIVAVTSSLRDPPAAMDALKTPTNDLVASASATSTSTTLEGTPASAATSPSACSTTTVDAGYELSGQLYFEQGYKLLAEQRQCESLADVQALGLLSLHEVRNGNEASARVLAQRCLRDVSAIRGRGTVEDGTFHAATAETYAGAFCLASMLDLVTYSQPGASRSLAWHAPSQFDDGSNLTSAMAPSPQQAGTDQKLKHPEMSHRQQQQSVAARHLGREASPGGYPTPAAAAPSFSTSGGKRVETFSDVVLQITTLACSRMNSMQPGLGHLGPGDDSGSVLDVYEKCLEWYNSALAMVQVGAGWTTSSLFLHMFYHFSLGVLFRPLLDQSSLVFRTGTISPRVICAESAQAVLALAQSFARLFTLQRTPTFVPYFVYAAGLLQMELELVTTAHRGGGQEPQPRHHHHHHQYQHNQPQFQQQQTQEQQEQQQQHNKPQLVRQGSDMVSGPLGTLKLGSSGVVAMAAQQQDAQPGTAEAIVLEYLAEMAQTHPAAAEALDDLRKRLLGG